MSTTPISPADARAAKIKSIPAEIFEVVNSLIVAKMTMSDFNIKVNDIIDGVEVLMATRDCDKQFSRDSFFSNGWLDIEPLYEAAGWSVKYHKPDIGRGDLAYFKFCEK